ADPADVFGAARVCCLRDATRCLQPRTMKRADVALTAGPALRPEKTGKMKIQEFSSPLTVRPLTALAIDVCVCVCVFGGLLALGGNCVRGQALHVRPELGLQGAQFDPQLRQALLREPSRPAREVQPQEALRAILPQDELSERRADAVDRRVDPIMPR